MPKINRLTANRAPVGPRPDPEAMGAAEGRALQAVGNAVGNVGDVFKQVTDGYYRQDTLLRAQEGDRKLRELAQQAGFQKFEDREKWFKEQAQEVYAEAFDGVGNQSKAQLRLYMDQSRNRFEASVRGTAYRDASNGAKLNLANSLEMIAEDAANATSQLDIAGYMQRAYDAIDGYGADFGASDAETTDIRLRFEGKTENLRAVAVERQMSDLLTTEILTATDEAGNPLSKEARLELVGQIGSDPIRKDVKRRVEVTTNREEADRLRALDTQREAAWTAVLAGGQLEAIPKDLPAKDRRQLQSHVRTRSEREAKGISTRIVTDAKRWADLWDMAVNEPDKFAAMNIWSERLKFETQDFNELKEAQNALKGGGGSGFKPALSGSDRTLLNDTLSAAGVTDTQTKAQARLNYKRAAEAQRSALGRDLTQEEKENQIDVMMQDITVPGLGGMTVFVFGEDKRIAELTEKDGKRLLEYPPDAWKNQAIDDLEAIGIASPNRDQLNAALAEIMREKGVPGVE